LPPESLSNGGDHLKPGHRITGEGHDQLVTIDLYALERCWLSRGFVVRTTSTATGDTDDTSLAETATTVLEGLSTEDSSEPETKSTPPAYPTDSDSNPTDIEAEFEME
jgi:hypothetical protein